ncbi:MAG: hypothetical protein ACLR23_04160 [Clostridia bacterium]
MDTIRVGIIGATGYAGEELVAAVVPATRHAETRHLWRLKSYAGQPYSKVYPSYRDLITDVLCEPEDHGAVVREGGCDLLGTAPWPCIVKGDRKSFYKSVKLSIWVRTFACRTVASMNNGIRFRMRGRVC